MQIRLPRMPRWGVRAIHWVNCPMAIRRIDLLLVVLGIGCTTYYGHIAGPVGALQGAATFAFVVLIVLWL
jgi:hypothetical protein